MKKFTINNARSQFLEEKGKFPVNCSDRVLRDKARELLEDFGYLFEALINGTLQPIDTAEKEFIEEIRQNAATTDCAKTWLRYRDKEKLNISSDPPRLIEDSFLPREGSTDIRHMLHAGWKDRNRDL